MVKKVRIAHFKEFDNGNVLFDYQRMDVEQAELKAKEASIKEPNDVWYVKFDDVMNPSSDYRWIDGKKYLYKDVQLKAGKAHVSGTPIEESKIRLNGNRGGGLTVKELADLLADLTSKGLGNYDLCIADRFDVSPMTMDNLKINPSRKFISISVSGNL